ncbi:MAG: hypothetical protein ABR915_17035 [Thermoguttaceae bacterium]|jgi:hypothetical protein
MLFGCRQCCNNPTTGIDISLERGPASTPPQQGIHQEAGERLASDILAAASRQGHTRHRFPSGGTWAINEQLPADEANWKSMTARRAKKKHAVRQEPPPPASASLSHPVVAAPQLARWTHRLDWVLFGIACLLAVFFSVVLYDHAGAFWRDETSSIQLASVLSIHTNATWLVKDSAPPLLHALLRLWTSMGFGATDEVIRSFGTVVFLGIVGALVVTSTMFTRRAPILAMAMVAFNPTIFYFGSSIRAYGLAMLFVLPCCCAFWRVVQKPTVRNVPASLVLALLSCHASYQNTYLLFAIGLAGITVCALCGLWKRSLLIMAICGATALSMLVYIPVIRLYAKPLQIAGADVTNEMIFRGLSQAIGNGDSRVFAVWVGIGAAALIFLVVMIVRSRRTVRTAPSLPLYALIVIVVAMMTAYTFFRANGTVPYPWHYVPLLALFGMMADVAVCTEDDRGWVLLMRTVAACGLMLLCLSPLWTFAHMRRTNIDRVCAAVGERAADDDFILVSPFWLSPGFKYYYHGAAPWNTLPLTSSDLEVSLFPQPRIRDLMTQSHAMDATFGRIRQTLSAGKRLWVVGAIQFLPPNSLPPTLPPAPQSQYGWDNNAYTQVWSMQAGYFVQTHAIKAEVVVPVEAGQSVNSLENIPLTLIEGWH